MRLTHSFPLTDLTAILLSTINKNPDCSGLTSDTHNTNVHNDIDCTNAMQLSKSEQFSYNCKTLISTDTWMIVVTMLKFYLRPRKYSVT